MLIEDLIRNFFKKFGRFEKLEGNILQISLYRIEGKNYLK